ncbi:MAG: uroporphyrinogen-III synthase [Bacteroidetes bacterium]|nr:uroporphyrinogen-III synthase [Bacteroidota bacterium]
MENKKTILITRQLRDDSLIRKWTLENSVQLIEKSFIQTAAVNGLSIPETDWVFFSSPQGVRLYFEHYPLKAKKLGALSEGTAQALSEYGHTADFTGNSAASTKETGLAFFKQIRADQTVLFPLSDISKKNISSQKTTQKVVELITYKTELRTEKLSYTPTLVLFTSPSNADGFLIQNTMSPQTKILAIGETTAGHLHELGFTQITVSESTNERDLIKAITRLI